MSSSTDLTGRRIIVTGAGAGLGAAYAEAVAAAGAAVLVNDLDVARATETADRIIAAGGTAHAVGADVADWDAARGLVDAAVEHFGGVDGLVNNAGILGRLRLIYEEEQDARRTIEVNVLGTMFPTAHLTRWMVANGVRGSIVNVTSGNQCGHLYVSSYGASKGAVATYTYSWARELEEHGIRVNAISPNAATNQLDQVVEQLGFNPEKHHSALPSLPDNAAAVVYLLSGASHELNGQVLRVAHESVGIMSHPLLVEPLVTLPHITPDTIAGAVEETLGDHLQPLGIATARVEPGPVLM